MAATTSDWRLRARAVIDGVLAGIPAGTPEPDLRRALSDAYPWGPRKNHPYVCWLKEQRAAIRDRLGWSRPPDKAEKAPCWEFGPPLHPRGPFFLDVSCGWCDRKNHAGCLVCGTEVRRLLDLLADADILAGLRAVRAAPADPVPRLVLADMLDERDYPEAADLFRGEATDAGG